MFIDQFKRIKKSLQRRWVNYNVRRKLPRFLRQKKTYLSRKEKNVIRRLYITTGNIHLINSLAIIEQLKETDDTPVENFVLVWSSVTNKEFDRQNETIARSFGIKHYYSCCGSQNADGLRVACHLMDNELFRIDQVYSAQLVEHVELYNLLYQGLDHIITDEGFGTLIPAPKILASQCKKMITTCYLDKLDYVEFSARPWRVEHIQKKYFDYIAAQCTKRYPWPGKTDKSKNTIIFCGSYSAAWRSFTADKLIARQNEVIESLIARGYFILYKPHPRATVLPCESEHLQIINTRLPMECYQLEEVVAIVSLNSSASIQAYHYNNVPGFLDYDFCAETFSPVLNTVASEYTPSLKLLLDIVPSHMENHKLKELIRDIYTHFLRNKPLMSQNPKVTQAYADTSR